MSNQLCFAPSQLRVGWAASAKNTDRDCTAGDVLNLLLRMAVPQLIG